MKSPYITAANFTFLITDGSHDYKPALLGGSVGFVPLDAQPGATMASTETVNANSDENQRDEVNEMFAVRGSEVAEICEAQAFRHRRRAESTRQ